MPELVEEGLNLAQSEQRRLLFCRFRQVHYDADVRAMVGSCLVNKLLAEICHPCSTLLAGAWKEVGIENSEETTVCVKNLVGFHVRMIDLDVGL